MINSYASRSYRGIESNKYLAKLSNSTINMVLMTILFLSSFALVYIKYQTQQFYIKQAELARELAGFNQDHQQLMLELASISSNSRVYESSKKIGMVIPRSKEIVVV